MAAPVTAAQLLAAALRMGLFDQAAFDEAFPPYRDRTALPANPLVLARELEAINWLTAFQVQTLLAGTNQHLVLGPYKLLEPLPGRRSVFLGEHGSSGRRVVLRILPAARAEDGDTRERFLSAGRTAAALDHPNVVRVYEVEQDNDVLFLVMEHVDGQTLRDLVSAEGPLSDCQAVDYLQQACAGLQAAWQAGLVHRDLKPDVLLVGRDGAVKVLDLGLTRFFHADEEMNLGESMLGIADYLAPDNILDARNVDILPDIYSLGCTFYFGLVGRPPFPDGRVAQKLIWHQTRQPEPIRSLRPDISQGLIAVITRMMAKNRGGRFQNPAEVSAALAALVRQPDRASPVPTHWPDEVVQLARSLEAGNECAFALSDALEEAGTPDLAAHFRRCRRHPNCGSLDLILRGVVPHSCGALAIDRAEDRGVWRTVNALVRRFLPSR